MAEFWYGASPSGIQRNHKKYYPACRGKCEPILHFLLRGINVEDNPLHKKCRKSYELDIVYEDEYLIALNKPEGVLSVQGREIDVSVLSKLSGKYGKVHAIHRLDMATSGILIFAKDEETYKLMQAKFSDREISKTYEAILDESPSEKKGTIQLSLSASFLNRPMQMFDINGKEAITDFEVVKENENGVHVIFKPKTGRTHQLRIHAAHHKGLNAPIKGDILYGTPEKRLHLHASKLEFEHPITNEKTIISCPSEFF